VTDEEQNPVVDNPSLAMAANAYRRLHGTWPEQVRFAPGHFAGMATNSTPHGLEILATAMDVLVSSAERSPRLTVSGRHGALTYDDQVTEADWDAAPFHAWLRAEAERKRA
jgi:hypothetical protein